MKSDLAQPTSRPLGEEVAVVCGIVATRNFGVGLRVEKEVRHELDDQRDIDMDGPFKFRQRPNVPSGHLEIHVTLKTLGRNDIPEVIDHVFPLGGHLHLDHRVVEEVTTIVRTRGPHVVRGSQGDELHRNKPCIRIGEQLFHMRKVRDRLSVEVSIRGMPNRFVHRVGTDPDGRPPEIELADVDGIERRIPRVGPALEDVLVGDRVVVQSVV